MNNDQIKQINSQTAQFYKNVAPQFSQTRQFPWKGWAKCLPYLKKLNPKNTADLGCGNGRFFAFLEANEIQTQYYGFDNNEYLLNEASHKYPSAKFIKKDIFDLQSPIEQTFDLVVGFGIVHHLPDIEFRQKWFSQLKSLINSNGIFIFTFWEKDTDTKPGDYLLDFSKTGNKRYFHKYPKKELDILFKDYKIIDEFYADGKTNDLNRYIIFKL